MPPGDRALPRELPGESCAPVAWGSYLWPVRGSLLRRWALCRQFKHRTEGYSFTLQIQVQKRTLANLSPLPWQPHPGAVIFLSYQALWEAERKPACQQCDPVVWASCSSPPSPCTHQQHGSDAPRRAPCPTSNTAVVSLAARSWSPVTSSKDRHSLSVSAFHLAADFYGILIKA